VPLHPDEMVLDGLGSLHQPVRRRCNSGEARCQLADTLMVLAVDRDPAVTAHPLGEKCARGDVNIVNGMRKCLCRRLMCQARWSVTREVGVQGAAEGDVDELESTTDREDRHPTVESALQGVALAHVACTVDSADAGITWIAAVQSRVNVSSAADDESVELCDESGNAGLFLRAVDAQRSGAGSDECMEHMPPKPEPFQIAGRVRDSDDGTVEVFVHNLLQTLQLED
jgi:hypothetical protein